MQSVCLLKRACSKSSTALCVSVLAVTAALGAPSAPSPTPMGIEGVVNAAMSGIARVHITGLNADQTGKQGLISKTGTAFLVNRNGYLVTNCHVMSIEKEKFVGPVKMTVEFADDRERLPVAVRGCDEKADLAVLHVQHVAGHRTPLRFAEPKSIVLGQAVVAIGYEQNLDGQPSVADGIISGVNRNANGLFSDLIQTNALVNEGNSGGPLLNLHGEVVGVVTYKQGAAAGIAYARSANTASVYVQLLIQHGEIRRADFGFTALYIPHIMQEQLQLPRFAVMVEKVNPQSPAQRCNLAPGDLIYEIALSDGRTLQTVDIGNLNDALALVKPGDTAKFNFMRLTEKGSKFAAAVNPVPASELKRFYATCTAPGGALSSAQQAGSPG
jgi:serine protease Do